MNRLLLQKSQYVLLVWLFMILALSSCSVQYVSRYDEQTEARINDIQRQVETLLQNIELTIGTPEADYANFVDAYKKLRIDAALLNTRAQAIDMNRITIEQSEALIAWLQGLEQLHQEGIASTALLAVPRQQAEQIFVGMLKFELAKKRQFDSAIINEE